MLLGIETSRLKVVTDRKGWQYRVIPLTRRWRLHLGKAVELDHAPFRSQAAVRGRHHQSGRQIPRRRHLAGDELAPDQVVESLGIGIHAGELMTAQSHVRRTNGLVRLLSALARPITNRLRWQVLSSKVLLNQRATGTHRLIAKIRRIGSHVGDVTRLVEPLRQRHRLLDAETHPRARRLLQRRRNKRRRGL